MCRFIIALHFPPDKQNLPFPVMLQSIFTYIFTNETFRGKPMKPSFSSRLKDFLQGAFSPVRLGLLLLIASYFAGTGIGWLSRHPSFFSFFPWNMESSVSSPADPSSTDTSSTDTPVSTGLTSLSCAIPSLTAPSEGNWGLSFQQDGQLPTGNATIESLKKYDAYYAKDTDEKVIFLTFDAGYENGNTPAILDALKKHQVKATFFVVGTYIESEPELIQRMTDEGHTVGNHTWHHPDMSKIASLDTFRKELEDVETAYKNVTGKEMTKYYRPPQGKYSESNLQMAKELGYKSFFWSHAYVDWYQNQQPSKEEAFEKLLNRIHPGALVLLHSTSATNAQILDELLTRWEEMGYQILPLQDLVKS